VRATERDCESNTGPAKSPSESGLGSESEQNSFTSPVTLSALLKESPVVQSALLNQSRAQTKHQVSFSDSDLTKTGSDEQC
jgi:hypothetical protein